MKENKWTFKVELHDAYGNKSYTYVWYNEINDEARKFLFSSPDDARREAEKRFPGHMIEVTEV